MKIRKFLYNLLIFIFYSGASSSAMDPGIQIFQIYTRNLMKARTVMDLDRIENQFLQFSEFTQKCAFERSHPDSLIFPVHCYRAYQKSFSLYITLAPQILPSQAMLDKQCAAWTQQQLDETTLQDLLSRHDFSAHCHTSLQQRYEDLMYLRKR